MKSFARHTQRMGIAISAVVLVMATNASFSAPASTPSAPSTTASTLSSLELISGARGIVLVVAGSIPTTGSKIKTIANADGTTKIILTIPGATIPAAPFHRRDLPKNSPVYEVSAKNFTLAKTSAEISLLMKTTADTGLAAKPNGGRLQVLLSSKPCVESRWNIDLLVAAPITTETGSAKSGLKPLADSLSIPAQGAKPVVYKVFGRDPFIPYERDENNVLPSPENLELVGVIYSNSERIALLQDLTDPNQSYALHEKDPVQHGIVAKITATTITFMIMELGVSHSFTVELKQDKSTKIN